MKLIRIIIITAAITSIIKYFIKLQEGSVGEDLIIRPLPTSYRNSSLDQHVVIKRDASQRVAAGDYGNLC